MRLPHRWEGGPLAPLAAVAFVESSYGIANKAAETVPSPRDKRVSPHTVRHATAVHLLRAGVDINTIPAWLGHVSLETTNRYVQVDLEMTVKALQACVGHGMDSMHNGTSIWHSGGELMAFVGTL